MSTTLGICLFLAIHFHAGSIAPSIFTSTTAALDSSLSFAEVTIPCSSFDMDEEIAKISTTCLTHREHELLSGNILRHGLAKLVNVNLVLEAQETIGLMELRTVLGFPPPGPWTSYSEPSEDEIAAAPTIEAYYELREPRSEMRSLDSPFFFEKNLPPAIMFLDRRIPAIRTIYRCRFSEIHRRPDADENGRVTIDRREVDRMLDEYIAISLRIHRAFSAMSVRNTLCLRASRLPHDS